MSTIDIERHLRAPLDAARIEHARGRRVIGYIGDDAPVELILAADALPVRLAGNPQATPMADRYLERSFGPAYRSILEQWLQGAFDFLEAIVFPRSNDSAQRLYYYVCELRRRGIHEGPRALIYDLARVDRDTSVEHTRAATHALASELGTSMDRLDTALARLRERVSLLRELTSMRRAPLALAGSDALRTWRSLQLDWTEDFEAAARGWAASAQRRAYSRRLLFAGSTPPDERFHIAAESVDCNIVDEMFDEAPANSVARWTAASPSLDAIAMSYRSSCTTAVSWLQTPDMLVERARSVGAHGVVLWLIEQDEGIVWEVPRQLERLRRAGIPVLSLTRQAWDADAACLDAVQRFAGSLGESP